MIALPFSYSMIYIFYLFYTNLSSDQATQPIDRCHHKTQLTRKQHWCSKLFLNYNQTSHQLQNHFQVLRFQSGGFMLGWLLKVT